MISQGQHCANLNGLKDTELDYVPPTDDGIAICAKQCLNFGHKYFVVGVAGGDRCQIINGFETCKCWCENVEVCEPETHTSYNLYTFNGKLREVKFKRVLRLQF